MGGWNIGPQRGPRNPPSPARLRAQMRSLEIMTEQQADTVDRCPKCGDATDPTNTGFVWIVRYICGSKVGGSINDREFIQHDKCRIRELEQQIAPLRELEAVAKAWVIDRNHLGSDCVEMGIGSSTKDTPKWAMELCRRENLLREFCGMMFYTEANGRRLSKSDKPDLTAIEAKMRDYRDARRERHRAIDRSVMIQHDAELLENG